MNAYMGHDGDPSEGAALIFAHTGKEAKKVFWADNPYSYEDYTAVRVTVIRDSPWLFRQADVEKLRDDQAHVIDNPISCDHCHQWGKEMATDKLCTGCVE